MKRIILNLSMITLVLLFSACNQRNQTSMKKNVTGKAGELVVVIDPIAWENTPGTLIKNVLGQDQRGLPQAEPLFDVINIPHEAFGDIFRTSRNLVIVKIRNTIEKNTLELKRDVHAYTQAVAYINAKSYSDFEKLLNENSDRLLAFFLQAERKRLLLNYSNYNEKAVSAKTEEYFGLTITVPPGFEVDKEENDFMWIRYETPEISQGIFIYTFPYEDDSTFTLDYMVAKRNIFLKKYVPGPTDGSYMTTDTRLPILFNSFEKDGNYATEMRGLWRVENNFMAGPFVNVAILDLLKNRVVVLDGFVYAPSKEKRNLLRQVEAMIYSAKFINQTDIDKINKQFDL